MATIKPLLDALSTNVAKEEMATSCLAALWSQLKDAEAFKALADNGGEPVIQQCMDKHPDNDKIQTSCRALLTNIGAATGKGGGNDAAMDVPDAIGLMKEDADDADKQSRGMKVIWHKVSGSEEQKSAAAEQGVLPLIAAAMSKHVNDFEVNSAACGLLQSLGALHSLHGGMAAAGLPALVAAVLRRRGWSREEEAVDAESVAKARLHAFNATVQLSMNDDMQAAVGDGSGIEALIEYMNDLASQAGDEQVTETGLGALWNLAERGENVEKISSADGIKLMSNCVSQRGQSASLCGVVCGALWNMSRGGVDARKREVLSDGGLEAVVAAMKAHPGDAEVQKNACGALQTLATSDATHAQLVAAGVLPLLSAALESPDDGVVRLAFGALLNLSMQDANQPAFAESGCVPALLKALKRLAATDVPLATKGVVAVWNLAEHEQIRETLMSSGGFGTIVELMQQQASDAALQAAACGVVWNMCTGNEQRKVAVSDCGAAAAVVAAVKAHGSDVGVQTNGLGALQSLTCHEGTHAKIMEAGGATALIDAMRSSESTVAQHAFSAFVNLSLNDANQSAIAAANGVAAIVSIMQQHADDQDLQDRAVAALWNLAENASSASQIVEGDALSALLSTMSRFADIASLQQKACGCIWQLGEHDAAKEKIKGHAQVTEALTTAMAKHASDQEVMKSALAAMQKL